LKKKTASASIAFVQNVKRKSGLWGKPCFDITLLSPFMGFFSAYLSLLANFLPNRYNYPAYHTKVITHHPLSRLKIQRDAQYCPHRGHERLNVRDRAFSPKLFDLFIFFLTHMKKMDALFSYKGFKAYQPLNTWWFEQGIVLHTEFRDGNVPAGFEQLRVFKDALAVGKLPSDDFGENAAWWWIMILALNLNAMMKKLAMELLINARKKIAMLQTVPSTKISISFFRRWILRMYLS